MIISEIKFQVIGIGLNVEEKSVTCRQLFEVKHREKSRSLIILQGV